MTDAPSPPDTAGANDTAGASDRRLRVVVADDHRLVRAGLLTLLAAVPDLVVVGEAGDGDEAVEVTLRTRPDVVLMDVSMPGTDGIAACARITEAVRADQRQTPGQGHGRWGAVVMLTSFSQVPQVKGALAAGAVGYLLKDSEPEQLVAGIRSAARGEAPLDPRVTRVLLPGATQEGPALSAREREVLALVAQGLTNRLIARRLGIAEHTVKVHLNSVFRRLGVKDRTAAAVWAKDNPEALTP